MNPFTSLGPGFLLVSFAFLLSAGRAFSATAYDTLEANFQKWKANHPHEYAFTYSRTCFCINPVWRVEVKGDSVVRVANISSAPGTPSALESYSMDSIFARIKAGLDKHPAKAQIRYNARLGYPEEAGFDQAPNVADDEYSLGVSDFIAATPADTLAFNYAKWKANRPAVYEYTYYRGLTCSCVYPTWRVKAHFDSVVQVGPRHPSPDTTRPNPDRQYYSIDSIFARIKLSLDSDPDEHSILYDFRRGFPIRAHFHMDTSLADAGYSYEVNEFTDLTVAVRPPRASSREAPRPGRTRGSVKGNARDLKGRATPPLGAGEVQLLRW